MQRASDNGRTKLGKGQRPTDDYRDGSIHELRCATDCLRALRRRIFSGEWTEHSIRPLSTGYCASNIYRLDISQTTLHQ